jgi:hypothetical protein
MMTIAQINAAVAKFDGWIQFQDSDYWHRNGSHVTKRTHELNYWHDLNLISGAVEKLPDSKYIDYSIALANVVPACNMRTLQEARRLLGATAPQRCEALLKHLNLWTD